MWMSLQNVFIFIFSFSASSQIMIDSTKTGQLGVSDLVNLFNRSERICVFTRGENFR